MHKSKKIYFKLDLGRKVDILSIYINNKFYPKYIKIILQIYQKIWFINKYIKNILQRY